MMNYKFFPPIILLSFFLISCSNENQDLRRFIQQVKTRSPKRIEAIPILTPLPGFKFPTQALGRNPFKPFNHKKTMDIFAPNQYRTKQALESFPLNTLKFVGTLTQEDQIWGLIEQPDSQISQVRIGDYLGQNEGRILSISNDVIQLEEAIKGSSGVWEKHLNTLELNTGR